MRPLVPVTLALGDVIMVLLVMLIAMFLRREALPGLFGLDPFSPVRNYLSLWPVLMLLVLVRALLGLYPGYGLHPAEELKRQTQATFALAFFVLAGSALFQFATVYSRTVLGLASILLLILMPIGRAFIKGSLARLPFYGSPIWIVGTSDRARELTKVLKASPTFGLRVVGESDGIPPSNSGLHHCLVVPDGLVSMPLAGLLDGLNERFRHVWLAPNLLDVASVWVTPRDLQGHLALELRNNLLEHRNRAVKRILDIVLAVLVFIVGLPAMLLIALWVRIDSPGPVLLRQPRVGKDHAVFTTYKFRTMRSTAEHELEKYLIGHPEAQDEWQRNRKLRNDPRVTRAGRILRRTSLDELPQLANVLIGDMSFVGPRPVLAEELVRYGTAVTLYGQVRPGLTGLMQVSGRSELSYAERVRLDTYYLRNWSVWLDLVILGRTVGAVLSGKGAF